MRDGFKMPLTLISGPMVKVLCPKRISEYEFFIMGPLDSVKYFWCFVWRVDDILWCNIWKEGILFLFTRVAYKGDMAQYPYTFFMNAVALKLLDYLTKFCSGLHAVDNVDVPQLMKTLFADADGMPQFINAMEVVQINSKRAKLEVQDDYMHAVSLKYFFKSGEYETKTREWSELP